MRRAAIPAHNRIRRWQARAVLLCELRRLRRLLPRAVRPDLVRPVSSQHPALPDGLVGHESERVSMQNRCALHSPVRPHRCPWLGLTAQSSASPVLAASQATTTHNSRLGRCRAMPPRFASRAALQAPQSSRACFAVGVQECTKCTRAQQSLSCRFALDRCAAVRPLIHSLVLSRAFTSRSGRLSMRWQVAPSLSGFGYRFHLL